MCSDRSDRSVQIWKPVGNLKGFHENYHPLYSRVRTGHGKPGKSWNSLISFPRPGKSCNLGVGHGKSRNLGVGYGKSWKNQYAFYV